MKCERQICKSFLQSLDVLLSVVVVVVCGLNGRKGTAMARFGRLASSSDGPPWGR
jgi:hypothetical protein